MLKQNIREKSRIIFIFAYLLLKQNIREKSRIIFIFAYLLKITDYLIEGGFSYLFLHLLHYNIVLGFPHSSVSKESACNAGDQGSIPGSGRSPGEENGNPLQYSCLENPMDRGA